MTVWELAALAVPGAAALGLGTRMTYRLLRYRSPGADHRAHSGDLGEDSAESSGWNFGCRLDRYRPMARLLDSRDLQFLASKPGFGPKMEAQLRKSRRRIFRMYLGELSADFQALHAAARRMAAEAPEQHADLIPLLMKQQVAFWKALFAIELRLTLGWAGVAPGDVRGLLDLVTQLQTAVDSATPATA